jgi:PRTRC genetic system protein B
MQKRKLVETLAERIGNPAAEAAIKTTLALLFHCRERDGRLELVTTHSVTDRSGAPVIGAGRALTRDDENRIIAMLSDRLSPKKPLGLIPANLLYSDGERLVWWQPSAVRTMHVREVAKEPISFQTRWPNLVFKVHGRTLSVATFEGDARPEADTELLQSTLANVYATTAVCTGTAILPAGLGLEDIPRWESVIFDTAFTHSNNHAALRFAPKGKTNNVEAFWKERAGVTKGFPYNRAVPLGETLASWIGLPSEEG